MFQNAQVIPVVIGKLNLFALQIYVLFYLSPIFSTTRAYLPLTFTISVASTRTTAKLLLYLPCYFHVTMLYTSFFSFDFVCVIYLLTLLLPCFRCLLSQIFVCFTITHVYTASFFTFSLHCLSCFFFHLFIHVLHFLNISFVMQITIHIWLTLQIM